MLKLFGHDASPYVRRVRVVLSELRLPFERDTHGWQDPAPEFTVASPIRRVPMLDLGPGAPVRHVFESRVIAALLYSLPHPKPGGEPPFQDTLFEPALSLLDQNVVSVVDAAQDSLVNVFLLENDGIRAEQSSYLRRQVDAGPGMPGLARDDVPGQAHARARPARLRRRGGDVPARVDPLPEADGPRAVDRAARPRDGPRRPAEPGVHPPRVSPLGVGADAPRRRKGR